MPEREAAWSASRGPVAFHVVFGVTLSSFILAQGLSGNVARIRLRHRVAVSGGFAVLVLTVAGNATSGATSGVHLLRGRAGAMSAVLPQGAAVRAVKSFGYFGGVDVWPSVVVLAA